MQSSHPLLTIAIPTYNRSRYLAELLNGVLADLVSDRRVQLLISDNCSTDDTPSMLESLRLRGLVFDYIRNQTNVGADGNFLQCFNLAAGKYVWVLGDDDILLPHAIPQILSLLQQGEEAGEYDLVYLSSVGFAGEYQPLPQQSVRDKLGRFAEVVTEGDYFLEKVNALIGLISVNIVNKSRLQQAPYPPIDRLNNTNLLQVGWIFPILHRKCRILYIWQRLLAYRSFNSGGWGISEVFGTRLHRIASEYFADEPILARSLMNGVLRYWMCDSIVAMRLGKESAMKSEDFVDTLRPVFGANWRYWLFVYSVAAPPLWIAHSIYRCLRITNKLTRAVQAVFRHLIYRDRYLTPNVP